MQRTIAVAASVLVSLAFPGATRGAPGKEFWAASSQDGPLKPFSIVVANPNPVAAAVEVATESGIVASAAVAPGSSLEFNLGMSRSIQRTDLKRVAYRIRSDLPVHAYQFTDFEISGAPGASILQDRTSYGTNFVAIAARADIALRRPSVVTVLATRPTRVFVTPSEATQAGLALPALSAGDTGTFALDAFDVLQIASLESGDLSGTIVQSDAPVQVFAGCSTCVVDGSAADDVQELMLPTSVWATQVLAVSTTPAISNPNLWRIVAAEDGTLVSTDPPLVGTPLTLDRGQMWETVVGSDFAVNASRPVQVARLTGCMTTPRPSDCDPSMCLMLSPERFSRSAVFGLSTKYSANARAWLDIVAKPGTSVVVDSVAVPAGQFTPIGSSAFSHARVMLDDAVQTHAVSADEPIAAYVTHDSDAASVASFPADIDFPPNLAPTCEPGGPYAAPCQGLATTLRVSAAASTDPESAPLAFLWSSIATEVSFSDAEIASPDVTVSGIGSFPLEVLVSDGANEVKCSTTVTTTGDTSTPTELSRSFAPLWLVKAPGGVRFSFEDRGPAPLSYGIYEGSLRRFDSHVPLACGVAGTASSSGRRETERWPGSGSRYYLVTATNCAAEGPSGQDPSLETCPP